MKWFGEPWPRADLRAAACEDDADRIPVPVGRDCLYCCCRPITEGDRGVMLPYLSINPEPPNDHPVHLECMLRMTVIQ